MAQKGNQKSEISTAKSSKIAVHYVFIDSKFVPTIQCNVCGYSEVVHE